MSRCEECGGSGNVHVPNGLNSYSRRCSHGCESTMELGARLLEKERREATKKRDARIRREALEEAAKVVDDLEMPDMWDGSIGRTDDGSAFRRNAVVAIRALAKEPKP